jgi:ABC-2 type transport system permease protein
MTQVGVIAAHEFRVLLRKRMLRLVTALVTLVVLLAVLAGLAWRQQAARERAAAREHARERWLTQGPKNPHGAAHFGTFVFAPVRELSALAPGYDEVLGTSAFIEAHTRAPLSGRPIAELPSAGRFGWPSMLSLCELLLPLLGVALGHACFAGERERSPLLLPRSVGVSARRVVLGKLVGVQLAMLACMSPLLVVVTALMLVLEPTGSMLARVAGLSLGLVLYGLAWAALAVAFSAGARTSSTSLSLGFATWAACCVVFPQLVSEWAVERHPIAGAHAFETSLRQDLEQGLDGHDPADARVEQLRERVLQSYGVERVEDLPVNFDGIALQAGEERAAEIFAHHFDHQWDALERQQAVLDWAWPLAPGLALRRWSTALAESDLQHHRASADTFERYRLDLITALNEAMTHGSRTGDWDYAADASLWAEIPDVPEVQTPEFSRLVARAAGALPALALWWVTASLLALAIGSRPQNEAAS